jgi:hypothetical protein
MTRIANDPMVQPALAAILLGACFAAHAQVVVLVNPGGRQLCRRR